MFFRKSVSLLVIDCGKLKSHISQNKWYIRLWHRKWVLKLEIWAKTDIWFESYGQYQFYGELVPVNAMFYVKTT